VTAILIYAIGLLKDLLMLYAMFIIKSYSVFILYKVVLRYSSLYLLSELSIKNVSL
jgi:hypothetical protein